MGFEDERIKNETANANEALGGALNLRHLTTRNNERDFDAMQIFMDYFDICSLYN